MIQNKLELQRNLLFVALSKPEMNISRRSAHNSVNIVNSSFFQDLDMCM